MIIEPPPPPNPNTFTDAAGRAWLVEFDWSPANVAVMAAPFEQGGLGVNLDEIAAADPDGLVDRVIHDFTFCGMLLWYAVIDYGRDQGVTAAQFFEALRPDPVADAAAQAALWALAVRYPHRTRLLDLARAFLVAQEMAAFQSANED
jgi:hypothetical protein